ncbi:MAG TPA: hypothetical protein VNU68_07175 [Verrucomicrobiae bacterium]|nr:hypothetical protein [Verrucomicrobiae bacterium]
MNHTEIVRYLRAQNLRDHAHHVESMAEEIERLKQERDKLLDLYVSASTAEARGFMPATMTPDADRPFYLETEEHEPDPKNWAVRFQEFEENDPEWVMSRVCEGTAKRLVVLLNAAYAEAQG